MVYTLMLSGFMPSTVTLRFRRYRSSILKGCLAPVGKSRVIMTAGPEDGSCCIDGASMAGPIASLPFRKSLGEEVAVSSVVKDVCVAVDWMWLSDWGSIVGGGRAFCSS